MQIEPLDGNSATYVQKTVTGFEIPFELLDAVGGNALTGLVLEWDAQQRVFGLSAVVSLPVYTGGTFTVAGVTWTVIAAVGSQVSVLEDHALPFTLADDDAAAHPFHVTSTLLTGCEGSAECEADPARNIFAQAYVRIAYDLESHGRTAPFTRNVASSQAAWAAQLSQGRDTTTIDAPGFWVGYIQGAFQEVAYAEEDGEIDGDGDPDTEHLDGALVGGTPYLSQEYGSVIFVESLRDVLSWPLTPILCPGLGSEYASQTVAHEVGHQFGLAHTPGEIMAEGCPVPSYFSAFSLNAIRSRGVQ